MDNHSFSPLIIAEIEATNTRNLNFSKYTDWLISPQGLTLLGCVGLLIVLQLFGSSSKKKKIATSYWGGTKEIAEARKKGLKQIKTPACDSASLYIGVHKYKGKPIPQESGGTPLYIPDIQRGTAVIGAPGSGKTKSVINPMIYSAIDQGFGLVIYDFKYPSQATIASYAKSKGYDVHIFAPGYPESEVCNILDFLRDGSDAESARQLATVINKNFRITGSGSEDAFFGPAGDQLTQAILMLTKEFKTADILTSAAILSTQNITKRLMAATFDPWVKIAFGQLFSSADSERTVSGITGTASILFTRFMAKNTLGCFVGKTTLPLEVGKKQLVIFGLDRQRRDAVGPLMTAILHMTISRSIAKKRKDLGPLVVSIDELPSIFLPDLYKWLNEARSEGFCGILGWQNMGQIEKIYGKEISKSILGGCATKFFFNPGEEESARLFSTYLGDEEITYKHKSRSTGGGKSSNSVSDQEKTKKLFEPAEFVKLTPGRCVFINPAYVNKKKKESSIPLLKSIQIPKYFDYLEEYNSTKWDKLVSFLARSSMQKKLALAELDERLLEVQKRFPMPDSPPPPPVAPIPTESIPSFF